MIADITSKETPGFDLASKALAALGRSSIPVNLVLPPHKPDGTPRPVIETPSVLTPQIVIDALDAANF